MTKFQDMEVARMSEWDDTKVGATIGLPVVDGTHTQFCVLS